METPPFGGVEPGMLALAGFFYCPQHGVRRIEGSGQLPASLHHAPAAARMSDEIPVRMGSQRFHRVAVALLQLV